MDYGTFRPETGYNAPAAPAVKSKALKAAETAGLVKEKEKFKELVVTDGVGQYHINHFISYGTGSASEVSKLRDGFFDEFVDVFQPNTAAEASWGEHEVKAHPTVEFEVGGEDADVFGFLGGLFHSDWVFMQRANGGESFYGSTLRRQFLLASEEIALAASEFGPLATRLELLNFIRVNQHHFLAGRRSWRLGYDLQLKRPYVETAAFERSSLFEYALVERTGFFRKTIIEIWTSLLENVRKHKHFKTINWISHGSLPDQSVRAGYETADNVDYRMSSFDSAKEALSQPWFAKILPRHPGLVHGL